MPYVIAMEFELRNHRGRIFLKEEVQKVLRTKTIRGMADARVVVLYPYNADLSVVAESLKLLVALVEHQARVEGQSREVPPKEAV